MSADVKMSAALWNQSYEALKACEPDITKLRSALTTMQDESTANAISTLYNNVMNTKLTRSEADVEQILTNLQNVIDQLRELEKRSTLYEEINAQFPGVKLRVQMIK